MIAATTSTNTESETLELVHRYDSPFFPDDEASSDIRHSAHAALILLNTPIQNSDPRIGELSGALSVLWRKSCYRICADGGANRLYQATVNSDDYNDTATCNEYLPDLITGDLDSLLPRVREYYEKRGVPIVWVEDQDYHDLDKALMATEKWLDRINSTINEPASPIKTKVFIYGGFGGRFDQEMACINALHVWGQKKTFRYTSLALYGEETCAFLLPAAPAVNEIRIPYPDCKRNGDTACHDIGEGPSCGLIPLGGRCDKVITTGLKWNLDGNMTLEFGGLVSSSNRIMDEVVTVETSSAMIFTTEMIKNCV